jgi:hypothetical protein
LRARSATSLGAITAELVEPSEPLPAVLDDGDRCI